jgi:hypothetical protein
MAHGLIGSALGIAVTVSMTSLMRTALRVVGPLGGHLAINWGAAAMAAVISAVSVTILCLLPALRVARRTENIVNSEVYEGPSPARYAVTSTATASKIPLRN